MEHDHIKYGSLFGGSLVSEEERFRIGEEVKQLGGLTFAVHQSADGWFAQCNENEGIIAANTNPKPTNAEIEAEIRRAIFAAFDVEITAPPVESPFKFEYSPAEEIGNK